MRALFFFTFLFLISGPAWGYDTLRTNLSAKWQTYSEETGFSNFDRDSKVVQFGLPSEDSDFVEIKQKQPFSVFFNDRLILTNQTKVIWPVDSLMSIYPSGLRISILSNYGVNDLSTYSIVVVDDQNKRLSEVSFQNFTITISVLLLVALVVLFRTSPQSTLEYFNVVKIFSVRNIDEGVVTTRVTSANNVFFYMLCSGLVATNLYAFSKSILLESEVGFIDNLMSMLYITVVVFFILMLKIIEVSALAWLFRLSGFAPSQFYNFIRLLLVVFCVSSVALILNFMFGRNRETLTPILIGFIVALLLIFPLITYAKLNSRGGFTVFHLFSYLCASEIIPIVILLKIYFS